MTRFLIFVLVVALIVAAVWWVARQRREAATQARLADALAEARRWIDRLGGQVLSLTGTDDASRQALADASERYTAAGGQVDQARTPAQAHLAAQTALEGLYYVRAARTAMGLDPGPPVPMTDAQREAGVVSADRRVSVDGHEYSASPRPSRVNTHYYPGGRVAGRPVPAGWYNEPWWRPALVAGAWGLGSAVLFSSLFAGMATVPSVGAWEHGQGLGGGEEFAGDGGDMGDFDGDAGGDFGGDFGGGDFGGGDFGGDFGGFGDFDF